MPIIESTTDVLVLAVAGLQIAAEGTGSIDLTLTGRAPMVMSASGAAAVHVPAAASSSMVFSTTAFGVVPPDPDIFGSASTGMVMNATLSASIVLNAGGIAAMVMNAVASSDNSQAEEFSLEFVITWLPPAPTGATRMFGERLTVDGQVIEIQSWDFLQEEGSFEDQLNITIADPADRALIMRDSEITFEKAEYDFGAGVWRYKTLLSTGYLNSSNYSIGVDEDGFSFTGFSDMHRKLNKTAERNMVIYNSSRLTLDAGDFETKYDSDGRSYTTRLVPIPGLTLFELFDQVFVNLCGFTRVRSNLDNYEITRCDFRAGQSLLVPIDGDIGMTAPTFEDLGHTLWIRENTDPYSSGSAAPLDLIVDDVERVGTFVQIPRIDGLEMTYQEFRRDYDTTSDRDEVDTVSANNNGDVITTTVTETWRDYFRNSVPSRPVRSERIKVHTLIQNAEGWVIENSNELFYYNQADDLYLRTKTVQGTLPDLDTPSHFPLVQTIATENEDYTWTGHPFELDKHYQSRRLLTIKGIVGQDSVNQQLGQDYTRDLVNLYRSGNLIEGLTIFTRAIRTVDERTKPVTREDVRIRTIDIDHLAKITTTSTNQDRVGDIGKSSLVNQQNTMYIFDDETSLRTEDALVPFNGGEMPLPKLIPLAKRVLRDKKSNPDRYTVSQVGFDDRLQKGVIISAIVRDDETGEVSSDASAGVFQIKGLQMHCGEDGYSTALVCKKVG